MKRVLRTGAKAALTIVSVLLALAVLLTLYHHISLKAESSKIKPNGQLVNVGGHNLHIYTEGDNAGAPTLVFLSGSGTAAPVYHFKPLYSLLSGQYRIAVVEKLGYGYADFADTSRDIDTLLAQNREALRLAGIEPPYVLIPHSMSGLEAIYWAVKYPEETAAIIGLDMAMPAIYQSGNFSKPSMGLLAAGTFIGLQRIPFVYPVSSQGLSNEEYRQAKYLTYRNAANYVVVNETKCAADNAETVLLAGNPSVPVLMFSSNGAGLGDSWIPLQEAYADALHAELVKLDCGHYIHQFEPETIAGKIREFLSALE